PAPDTLTSRPHHPSSSTAPPTPEIHPLSLHDALPILHGPDRRHAGDLPQRELHRGRRARGRRRDPRARRIARAADARRPRRVRRSEEHTSELQSRENLVCRLLLEKKKKEKKRRRTRCN